MNRAERILSKYGKENITFDIITNGCIKVIIRVNQSCKRIVALNEDESDVFIRLI